MPLQEKHFCLIFSQAICNLTNFSKIKALQCIIFSICFSFECSSTFKKKRIYLSLSNMDQTWVPGRKRSHLPSLGESSDSDPEEIVDHSDASKKMRVGTASVHKEFEQTRGDTGRFKSVCKHCPTTYSHRI